MGTFTVRPEGIIRQPALTMPGNATGSEAACTALTGSQIRAICGLGTTDIPTFGGMTLNGNLLLSPTNTYDIGNGTYDPRTVRAATSVLTPLVLNTASQLTLTGGPDAGYFSIASVVLKNTASATEFTRAYGSGGLSILALHAGGANPGYISYAGATGSLNIVSQVTPGNITLKTGSTGSVYCVNSSNVNTGVIAASFVNDAAATTLGNSTYGVTVPGAAVVSGNISMSKTSGQGYIYVYNTLGAWGRFFYSSAGEVNIASSNDGAIVCKTASLQVFRSGGLAGDIRVYDHTVGKYIAANHDGTNGILSTSSGALVLSPATSIIGIGGITSSYPAIKRSSTTAAFRLGDDSADAPISCAGITASGVLATTSGRTKQIATKSANYTLTTSDHVVIATANTFDFTLPTAVGATAEYEMINAGTGVITIKTTSAQTISGSASGALTLAQWKSMTVQSDGSNWLIVNQVV